MTEDNKRAVSRKLSRRETLDLYNLTKEHIKGGVAEGLVIYEDDWSDAKVAEVFNATYKPALGISASHVGSVRRELLGDLNYRPDGFTPKPGGKRGWAAVDRNLRAIATAHNALCDKLGEPALKVTLEQVL